MAVSTRGAAVALALATSVLAATRPAAAHPAVDEARGRYERGDFEGALSSLDALEDEAGLSLDELVALLELRVLAARALGDDDATDRALEALASLRPTHRFGPEVPPVVTARFAAIVEASTPLALDARADADGDHVVIRARARHDPARLSRGVRLHTARGGAFRAAPGPSLRVRLDPGAELAWFAELIGPGGAVLREAGSRQRPRSFRAGAPGGAAAQASSGDVEAWPFLLAGGLAIAAGVAITLALVLTAGVDTEIDGPIAAGFP